jgi:NADPH:quinone reductase-like Zn-dependent oxidoreductase
LLNGQTNLF